MLVIPLTDFSKDAETWINTAAQKDLIVEKNGKPFVKISSVSPEDVSETDSIRSFERLLTYKGCIHRDIDAKKELAQFRDEKYENLNRYQRNN